MIKIYHNPRCRKSREALNFLQENKHDFEVVLYLEDKLTLTELKGLIKKLEIKPMDLIRKEEALWKKEYKSQNLGDAQLINLMIKEPKLMQRPIVVKDHKAVVARPLEALESLF